MNNFLQTARLALTPLSPIHIGMGEDFEPTNYIIDVGDKLLYAFDPSLAALPSELRDKLLELADSGRPESIHKIYKLLLEEKDRFIPLAHSVIPVSDGIAEKYAKSLGEVVKTESALKQVFNNNYIERATHIAGDGRPYLPGSSVKGAIRTAWLEALYTVFTKVQPDVNLAREKDFESTLLGGNFQTSPLRLLKIADFMPQSEAIDRKILFACNYKKRPISVAGRETGEGKGPSARKEVILSGQYRAFVSETGLFDTGKPIPQKTPAQLPNFVTLAKYCNDYYLPRMKKELQVLGNREFAPQAWLTSMRSLLDVIEKKAAGGAMFLLRLGRYGGAENKTIQVLARIKINGGRNTQPRYEKESTTLWLAAEKDKYTRDLLPFGWALIEIDPQNDCGPLRQWCEEERKGRPDVRAIRSKAAKTRAVIDAQKEAEQAARAEHEARVRADAEARERKEREFASMSEEQRLLLGFREKLAIHPILRPSEAGADILTECVQFLEQALVWPEDARKQCVEQLAPLLKDKNMYLGKKGALIKDALKKLRG